MSQQPRPGTRSAVRNLERAAPGSPIWPCTRWGFPCLRACAWSGGLLPHLFTLAAASLPRPRRFDFLRHYPSGRLAASPPACIPPPAWLAPSALLSRRKRPDPAGYAASRPLVLGLSSLPEFVRGERFSALPKSGEIYSPRPALARRPWISARLSSSSSPRPHTVAPLARGY